jgi:bifunctional N-acetylglucosamine-1-phosphate-uridyltransferase/glucosamine-1-phosphate-acetyltransferase GlmU-like protein
MNITAGSLAAGKGRACTPPFRVLHSLDCKPIVWYPIEATRQITGHKPVLVIGYGAERFARQLVRPLTSPSRSHSSAPGTLHTGGPILRGVNRHHSRCYRRQPSC